MGLLNLFFILVGRFAGKLLKRLIKHSQIFKTRFFGNKIVLFSPTVRGFDYPFGFLDTVEIDEIGKFFPTYWLRNRERMCCVVSSLSANDRNEMFSTLYIFSTSIKCLSFLVSLSTKSSGRGRRLPVSPAVSTSPGPGPFGLPLEVYFL